MLALFSREQYTLPHFFHHQSIAADTLPSAAKEAPASDHPLAARTRFLLPLPALIVVRVPALPLRFALITGV